MIDKDDVELQLDPDDLDQVVSFLLLRVRAMEELLVGKKILSKKAIEDRFMKLYKEVEKEAQEMEVVDLAENKKFLD